MAIGRIGGWDEYQEHLDWVRDNQKRIYDGSPPADASYYLPAGPDPEEDEDDE